MKKILTIMALLVAFVTTGFAQDTWTVAGSSAVFGSNWDINDNTNNMTYDSNTGLWTLTKSNVTLTKDVTYEYKVVKNHSWNNENYGAGGQWGGDNKTFTVEESASYDVTITFDYENGKTLTENCVKVGTAQNAEITQVDIRGEFNSWSVSDNYKFTKGDGDVYTLTLDLSSVTNDQAFKLVINGSEWLGYQSSMSIDAPAGWIEDAGGNDHNYKLKNSTTGYKTYTLTATWVANSDATSGWTLKIEGKDKRVAEITSVVLKGSWDEWGAGLTLDKDGTEKTLDLTNVTTSPIEFKLYVNGNGAILGSGQLTLVDAGQLVTAGTTGSNFSLNNTTYKTYTIKAEWTEGPDAAADWTLTIAGKDERIAEITSLSLGVDLNLVLEDGVEKELDLSTTLLDKSFKLIVNDNIQLGTNQLTLVAPEGMVVSGSNNGDNFTLKNGNSGFQTYTVKAEWATPNHDASKNWKLTIAGKDERVLTYAIVGELTGGFPADETDLTKDVEMTKQNNGLYTLEVASFAAEAKAYEYKLRANKMYGLFDLPASGNQTWTCSEAGNYKLTFVANVTNEAITDDTFGEIAGYTLTLIAEKIPENATISSLVIKSFGYEINFAGFGEGNEYSKTFDLSMLPEQYASVTTVPFQLFVNENETAIPIDNITIDSEGTPGLLVKGTDMLANYLIINRQASLGPVYEATATWTPSPDATAGWTLKLVSRPEIYSVIYKEGNNEWAIGDEMTENNGVFTATFSNKPGMLFAIAPSIALDGNEITWSKVVRPKTQGDNWKIYFANYNGSIELNENGKVWQIASDESQHVKNNSDVTIDFDATNNSFAITCEATVAISGVGYATYSNAGAYKVNGAEVYTISAADASATFNKLADGAEIPAGTGVILKGSGDVTITPSAGTAEIGTNLLIGSGDYSYIITESDNDAYIFQDGTDGVGFYKVVLADLSDDDKVLPAHKAFLKVAHGGAPFYGFGGEGTTGINSVERGMLNVEGCYTLDGRRVENPTKGLYIINGKKVIVK